MPNPNPNNARESMRWYVRIIKNFPSNMAEIKKEKIGQIVAHPQMGKMCHYHYDPKLKAQLPYYDRFPLVIPLDPKPDGILGLNVHYLPPGARETLFSSLMTLNSRKDLTPDSQIMLTYIMLKETSRFPGWRDCIKRYLSSHVRSPVLEIDPTAWDLAIQLPTAHWAKGRPY